MSFGYAGGDFVLITQLAWATVQNARRACGAHDELTREVSNLHIVLQRLEHEVSNPESLLNRGGDNSREGIGALIQGCERVLRTLSRILDKYNALPEEKRRVTRLWQKVRFGNGEMLDLGSIRLELATHTNAVTMFVNLLILGSQGKLEKHMDNHSEELKRIRRSLNWISASFHAVTPEGTVWTSYADDDKDVWRKFRRELIKEGFKSSTIEKHKPIIVGYLTELGSRGAFDRIDGAQEMPSLPDPDYMKFIHLPLPFDSNREEDIIPGPEATPSDALRYSIDPYSYCLKHWDPREAPIQLVGSIFDMGSLSEWAHENVCAYNRLHASRVTLGSQPNHIETKIERLKGLLTSFQRNLALVQKSLPQASGSQGDKLRSFVKHCEKTPKQFQKFVDGGEKRVLSARINRRLGECQESRPSNDPLKLSELEWRGRNAIQAVWKAQPVEMFGKRAGLDFVRNLAKDRDPDCGQAYSLVVLFDNLRKLDRKFKQDCESICAGISQARTESVLDQTQQDLGSSSSPSLPMPRPLFARQGSGLEAIESLQGDDGAWREEIIKVMGKTPVELASLETFLRGCGIAETDLEAEVVKLIVETRNVYPNGGKLVSFQKDDES